MAKKRKFETNESTSVDTDFKTVCHFFFDITIFKCKLKLNIPKVTLTPNCCDSDNLDIEYLPLDYIIEHFNDNRVGLKKLQLDARFSPEEYKLIVAAVPPSLTMLTLGKKFTKIIYGETFRKIWTRCSQIQTLHIEVNLLLWEKKKKQETDT
jgi:hypothetical protein